MEVDRRCKRERRDKPQSKQKNEIRSPCGNASYHFRQIRVFVVVMTQIELFVGVQIGFRAAFRRFAIDAETKQKEAKHQKDRQTVAKDEI